MYSIWFVKRRIFKVHLIFLFVLWVVLLFPKKNCLLQIHENFHLYLLPEVQFLYLSVIIFQLIFVYIIRKDFKFLTFPKGYLIVLAPLVGQSIWIKITIEFSRQLCQKSIDHVYLCLFITFFFLIHIYTHLQQFHTILITVTMWLVLSNVSTQILLFFKIH